MPLVLLALGGVLIVLNIAFGGYKLPVETVWKIILHHTIIAQDTVDKVESVVVWDIRAPRTLAGFVIGGALALAGATMQGMFRNPLADPGLIGVSAGASLFASMGIVMGVTWFAEIHKMVGVHLVPLFSFTGGVLVTFLIYYVSLTPRGVSLVTMLLAGIAINGFVGAILGIFAYIATDEELRTITFWSMGSLGGIGWTQMHLTLALVIISALLVNMHRGLNLLLLGETEARYMGLNTKKFNRICIVLTALIIGFSVALAGMIGFVGIIVPHLLRMIIGPDHRYLLPNAFLGGGCLLVAADLLSRVVAPPAEIPIGIITAVVGSPVFLYILIKHKKSMAGS